VVCAPQPILEFSSKRVLTAEWVNGQRLDAASNSKGDVGKLCAVGLTAYLTICILDWGLVTKVEGELQITFLEHIAHLTSRDYPAIPGDLVRLGFVPEGQEEAIAQAGVAEVLGTLYAQLAGGGGAKKIDVNEVARTMTGLTQNYGECRAMPKAVLCPARCLLARCLSVEPRFLPVLCGIGRRRADLASA
jgi:predicted unusual protein kinase regulating ubiquinone biosynthesis (AarF/ABC1/UbiB family)